MTLTKEDIKLIVDTIATILLSILTIFMVYLCLSLHNPLYSIIGDKPIDQLFATAIGVGASLGWITFYYLIVLKDNTLLNRLERRLR